MGNGQMQSLSYPNTCALWTTIEAGAFASMTTQKRMYMKFTINLLAKFSTFRLWVILVAASILMTVPIVGAMSILLKQKVDPDFLLTGLVASFVVASLILAVVLHFLRGQRQIEETLRASEEKLRTMFEMSPLGMARNSMDGRYIEVNKALLDMVGYSLEELNRLSYWDLTPLEYGPQEEEQLNSLNNIGRYGPYEKEYFHHNGYRIPVRLSGVLVTGSDGGKYIWSTVEDISERMKQLEALKKHHEEIERIAYHDILTDLPNR